MLKRIWVDTCRFIWMGTTCWVCLTSASAQTRLPSSNIPSSHVQQSFETNSQAQTSNRRPKITEAAYTNSTNNLQPTPLLEPTPDATDTPAPTAPTNVTPPPPSNFATKDVVKKEEAVPQSASDLGSLLKKSNSSPSTSVQSRTPIVHDPRIRGSRIGSLAASGSYWVPARIDLDTILSKFDSRQVQSVTIIPGPYTSLLGPGVAFADIQLLQSPRYDNVQFHGETSADYRANGNQYFGQQSVMLGSQDWGGRFNYGLREGGNYRAGNGQLIPSAYQSQEMTLALGRDWKDDSLEVSVLRLDQNNVLFPGYVFDIDNLVTDGYEATHTHREFGVFDALTTDVWYNRTAFVGNAQNVQKRQFFPALNLIAYQGFTDVDSMSTGYRQAMLLGGSDNDWFKFSVGHDFRFIKQELNEISSGVQFGLPIPFNNSNSPIPKSFQANPGVFAEYEEQLNEDLTLKAGGRFDFVQADITDDPQKLANVGITPAPYANVVGTDQSQSDYELLSGFGTVQRSIGNGHSVFSGLGYAERAPTLTELYAAQPFMLVLQNGLNNVTGDPRLTKEKFIQADIGWEYRSDVTRTGVRAFHTWGYDYITFENTRTSFVPPNGDVGQVALRYVNTDRVTFRGVETFSELLPASLLTPFATLKYVEADDLTRDGRFATTNGSALAPSQRVIGASRGAFNGSNTRGGAREPLPGIAPLDTRLGLRLRDPSSKKRWTYEVSARIVDQQNRVATSLFETPTPGFTTWDMRSVIMPFSTSNFVVSTGIENFLDRTYREHLDFRTQNGLSVLQPGATFYLSSCLTY